MPQSQKRPNQSPISRRFDFGKDAGTIYPCAVYALSCGLTNSRKPRFPKSPTGSPEPSPLFTALASTEWSKILGSSPPARNSRGRPLSHPGPSEERERGRRNSLYSSRVPLPHQPQPHFHTTSLAQGPAAGTKGYYCGLDSLENGGEGADNLLVSGHEGGLQIYRLAREKLDIVGTLDGLRGGVIGAKLLPQNLRDNPFSQQRPLIALVIHGPVSDDDSDPDTASSSSDSYQIRNYRTTVEVYSLADGSHICTLFSSPLIPTESNATGFMPPPPSGRLAVNARGNFVTVTSGQSGEIFIFAAGSAPDEFRFLAKLWTTVQGDEDEETTALHALGERWFAYAPATPSKMTLNGTIGVPYHRLKPFGLGSHTAPPQPPVNCNTLSPDTESFLNRVAREATQEFIKSAKWVGDQGMQLWNNYWNPEPTNPNLPQNQFPPTHAPALAPTNQPALVSIIDLQTLLEQDSPLKIMATFQVPLGCSFLSFSPSGLALLTASRKGDVQYVWDLTRVGHGKPASGPSGALASITGKSSEQPQIQPHVRQIARFTRMTVARIVDVSWAEPVGERLALVTERGTVHLMHMPNRAYQWPPPRAIVDPPQPQKETPDETPALPLAGATSAVTAAVKMVNNRAQPYIAAARRRRSSGATLSIAGLGLNTGESQSPGDGLSKSLNNETRPRRGDSRIHMTGASFGCIRWLSTRERGLLATVSSGTLRLYETTRSSSRKKSSSHVGRFVEFSLPALPDDVVAPAALHRIDLTGRWDLKQPLTNANPHFLSQAEIETSVPYQPFHTDRRITLNIYEPSELTFGDPISEIRLNITTVPDTTEMENVVSLGKDEEVEQIVITTRRKRNARDERDGFFEDDLEIVDFATDRI